MHIVDAPRQIVELGRRISMGEDDLQLARQLLDLSVEAFQHGLVRGLVEDRADFGEALGQFIGVRKGGGRGGEGVDARAQQIQMPFNSRGVVGTRGEVVDLILDALRPGLQGFQSAAVRCGLAQRVHLAAQALQMPL